MAKKRVYLHIGPAVPGVHAPHAALRDSEALETAGLAAPKVDQAEMDCADVEVRRRHKAHGLRRRDVEGAWAEVCRRAFKKAHQGYDVVISQPGFAEADYQQVALALDGLVGLQLHLVVTPGEDLHEGELRALVGEWAKFVRKEGRVHVLALDPGTAPEEFTREIARLALRQEQSQLERRLLDLTRQRSRLRLRLGRVGAAPRSDDADAA